jgi:hypothetical protein
MEVLFMNDDTHIKERPQAIMLQCDITDSIGNIVRRKK